MYIPDQIIWNELSHHLIHTEKFKRDKTQPYRFTLEGLILDLIPFGGLEQNGEVILENPHTELSVYGCHEVTEEAVTISEHYKVISLPGLCVMKLIAFGEKPESRIKDWDDFSLILRNYGIIAGDVLYESPYEDLITEDFEFPLASARLMGRHLQFIVNKNVELKSRITKILQARLLPYTLEEIDRMYKINEGTDQQVILLKMITQTLQGLSDQL